MLLLLWSVLIKSNTSLGQYAIIRTYAGIGAPPTSAIPADVAIDGSGNLYVTEPYSQLIYKLSGSTYARTIIAGTGTLGFSGDGGPATSAQFNYPHGLAAAP